MVPGPAVARGILLHDAALELGRVLPAGNVIAGLYGSLPPVVRPALHSTGALAEGLSDTLRLYADYRDKNARKIVCRRKIRYAICSKRPVQGAIWPYCAYGYADPAG